MPNELQYFIQWRGQETGPFSESEVLQKIETHEISSLHRIRCNEKITSVRAWIDEAQSGSAPTPAPVENPPTPAAIHVPRQVSAVPAASPPQPAGKTLLVAVNGKSSEYDENTVRSLLQQGIFNPNTLFWKNGMSNWQPLSALFPEVATATPSYPPVPGQQYTPVQDFSRNGQNPIVPTHRADSLSSTLKIMICVCGGVAGLSLLGAMTKTGDLYALLYLLHGVSFLATSVIFLMWLFHANKSCRELGATGMRFTPGWAVGDFLFFPFNLYRTYQIMNEIWRASHSPSNWKTQAGDPIIWIWWFLLWVPQLSAGFAGATTDGAGFAIVYHLVFIIRSAITFFMVSKIAEMQRAQRNNAR